MALAVALLYFFAAIALLGLLIAPVMLVKRAFAVRPLQRKWRKIKGPREILPMEVQASALYKWFRHEEERFHNTRTVALVSVMLFAMVLEAPVLLRGYKFEKLPTTLEDINKLAPALFEHLSKTFGGLGWLYVGAGVGIAAVAAVIAVNLLDLLGDVLGTPVRIAKDRVEAAYRRDREDREEAVRAAELAAKAPATAMLNFYEELDVATNATQEAISEQLDQFQRKWEQKEARGNPAVQEKARRMLDLIAEARKVLLDPARRTEFDRKLGLRGEELFTPASPKSRPHTDPRQVSDDQMAHIEEMKRRRKAEKADREKT